MQKLNMLCELVRPLADRHVRDWDVEEFARMGDPLFRLYLLDRCREVLDPGFRAPAEVLRVQAGPYQVGVVMRLAQSEPAGLDWSDLLPEGSTAVAADMDMPTYVRMHLIGRKTYPAELFVREFCSMLLSGDIIDGDISAQARDGEAELVLLGRPSPWIRELTRLAGGLSCLDLQPHA